MRRDPSPSSTSTGTPFLSKRVWERLLIALQPKEKSLPLFFMEIEFGEEKDRKTPVILSECSGAMEQETGAGDDALTSRGLRSHPNLCCVLVFRDLFYIHYFIAVVVS